MSTETVLKLGLSSCLAGNAVRYDGDDSYHPKIMQELAKFAEFEVICPEMAIGLGVPRKPIQLCRQEGIVRVRGVENPEQEVTQELIGYAEEVAGQAEQLCGFILKKGSPSCGMANVRIMDAQGEQQVDSGMGMFAYELQRHQPYLPMIDEWQMADSQQYDHFIERVFALWHWRQLVANEPDLPALQAFHQRFALNLLLHDARGKYDLDAWLQLQDRVDAHVLQQYFAQFMTTLAQQADAMQRSLSLGVHLNELAPEVAEVDVAALQEMFQQHGAGMLPLSFVLGAIRQVLAKYELRLWQDCNCLFPCAAEQALRYPV